MHIQVGVEIEENKLTSARKSGNKVEKKKIEIKGNS